MRNALLWAAAFVLMFIAASQAENVISVNFESWGSVNPHEYAGVVEVINWNDTWLEGNPAPNPMIDLNDNANTVTTCDVSWVDGTWGIRLWDGTASGPDTAGTRNVSLMKGYLDKHAPELTAATFTDIPYASYNVYVYVMADVANRAGNVTDGTTTRHFLTDPSSVHFTAAGTADYVDFKEITATDAGSAVLSNYAVFKGLTGSSLTISCSVSGGGGIAGIQIVEDAFRPTVTPDNGDGTFGTLISPTQGQVTLGWMALRDPNTATAYPVNPAILGHYLYLSSGDDETPELLDYVMQVHNADPYLTDPSNEYGPITVGQGKTYYWKVEEALNNGTGNPNGPGDPNNIMGPLWSFRAVAAAPQIFAGPEHAIVDANGNASLTVTTGSVATDFRWFKVGDPEDSLLADGGIYAGTQTGTLLITGATVADEGAFYCIAYNGDPDNGGIPSLPSKNAKLWYPRLVSRYTFETINAGVVPDDEGNFDLTMMSADTGTDVPVLDAESKVGSYGLKFNNPAAAPADPNNVDGQYAVAAAGAGEYLDITISVWVYSNGGGPWQRILDFGSDTDHYMFLCTNANGEAGNVRFAVKNGGEQSISSGAGRLPAGEWTYVAATLIGSTARLYINGEQAATGNITHNPIDYAPALHNYVGKSQWPDPYFNGVIDELKIYNYGLATYDVAQEYLAVAGGSVCNKEGAANMRFDKNGDCKVNLVDFAEFAADWLNDNRVYPQ